MSLGKKFSHQQARSGEKLGGEHELVRNSLGFYQVVPRRDTRPCTLCGFKASLFFFFEQTL